MILRQVDEAGCTRHIVCHEDGSVRAFGGSTIDSLFSSAEEDSQNWLNTLADRDLRGLTHELGRRLVVCSQQYQHYQEKLLRLAESADLNFFGLDPSATEKDLDNAYRRLAKKMHPDKNGGNEHAKERFQKMRERYEALKARRFGTNEADKPAKDEEEKDGKQEKDGKDEKGTDNGRIEFDPTDRKSLDKTLWKMLGQFRTLNQGLKDVMRRLGK